jgi:hypothetical protein
MTPRCFLQSDRVIVEIFQKEKFQAFFSLGSASSAFSIRGELFVDRGRRSTVPTSADLVYCIVLAFGLVSWLTFTWSRFIIIAATQFYCLDWIHHHHRCDFCKLCVFVCGFCFTLLSEYSVSDAISLLQESSLTLA